MMSSMIRQMKRQRVTVKTEKRRAKAIDRDRGMRVDRQSSSKRLLIDAACGRLCVVVEFPH
jgi:hypothetical protein